MKKILLVSLVVLAVVVSTTNFAKSRIKSYYSGDAIVYNDQLVVGSTNTDSLELFKLESGGLKEIVKIRPFDSRFHRYDAFSDLKFSEEDGRLYVYTISGPELYKYDISNLGDAALVKKVRNSYWEWYSRVDKFGNDLVTISSRGVKVWDKNLEVFDSYEIKNDIPYNIRSNNSGDYIFNINDSEIEIFDRQARKVTKNIQVNYRNASGNRSLYYDSYDNQVYVVDDFSAKKFDFETGALKGTFEHIGYPGYDISSPDNSYLYFSNGLGVVKLDKESMKLLASQKTNALVGDAGWAMGLKAIHSSTGDKVVLFNNSNILVLDNNLKLLGYVKAQEDNGEVKAEVKEDLFLKVNLPFATPKSNITVSGGGYYPNEKLAIEIAGQTYEAQADESGRFEKLLTLPDISESRNNNSYADRVVIANADSPTDFTTVIQRSDIKVSGKQSGRNYSLGFEIRDFIK